MRIDETIRFMTSTCSGNLKSIFCVNSALNYDGVRRFQYEDELKANPYNYDAWFDYVRLEEQAGDPDKVTTRVWMCVCMNGGCIAEGIYVWMYSITHTHTYKHTQIPEMYERKHNHTHTHTHTQIREVYERAIANKPPSSEKRAWRRYIYLWIYYAVFEELNMQDPERTRAVRICMYVCCVYVLCVCIMCIF